MVAEYSSPNFEKESVLMRMYLVCLVPPSLFISYYAFCVLLQGSLSEIAREWSSSNSASYAISERCSSISLTRHKLLPGYHLSGLMD